MGIHSKRVIARMLCCALMTLFVFGSFVSVNAETTSPAGITTSPAAIENVALGKKVASSSSFERSVDGWQRSYLNDGNLNLGWTTDPNIHNSDPLLQDYCGIDLGAVYDISKVVLYPRSGGAYFPVDYDVEISADGYNYTTVQESIGNTNVTTPQAIEFTTTPARYVKMVCKKQTNNGSGDYLVQIMEMEVYGVPDQMFTLNKDSLTMNVGETEQLTASAIQLEDTPNFTWSSSNDSVATVTNGLVSAVSTGNAVITATDEKYHQSYTCNVTVTVPSDDFIISAFWPPVSGYINSEQYDLLAGASINYLHNVEVSSFADRIPSLKLAAERGIKVGVSDSRFSNSASLSDEQIGSVVDEYRNVSGVGGYYICDEPSNANQYARVYKCMLQHDYDSAPYLNFLPYFVYPSLNNYVDQLTDFTQLVGSDSLKYLMYDTYPFGKDAGTISDGLYINMDTVRKVGLKNNVKTATFIQSVGIPGNLRRTNENEIRYEVSCALAYGYKQISYFTWWTPTHRSEVFTDAIISADGKPTDLYQPVCDINRQVKTLGPTLMKLDAKEVYHSGTTVNSGTKPVPDNFFFKVKGTDDVILSYMRDRVTGKNYVMAVNKSITDSKTLSFITDSRISSINEVDKTTGTENAVAKSRDGSYTLTFAAGEARLFAMPDGFDYSSSTSTNTNFNLALKKNVTASSSAGKDYWYINKINDGIRFSQFCSNGWQTLSTTSSSQNDWLTVDLGSSQDFNRVDLYPANGDSKYGMFFPVDFDMQVSTDKVNWKTVASYKDYPTPTDIPSIKFDKQNARYVRINITKMNQVFGEYKAELSEIEIYNDNGNIPQLPNVPTQIITSNTDLALKQAVLTSSTFDAPTAGWSKSFLVDGQKGSGAATNGYTSSVGTHMDPNAEEWAEVFLGGMHMINKVVVTPRADGSTAGYGFPDDYRVDVSGDGNTWTTVKTVTGDVTKNADPRVLTFDSVNAAYVKFVATKLSGTDNPAEGYLLQLGELEVYGNGEGGSTPNVNTEKSQITLDGKLDEAVWNKKTTSLDKLVLSNAKTISADFNTAWDSNNLYLGIKVTDPTGEKTDFTSDSITFYISPKDSRIKPYSEDDFQVQIFDQGKSVAMGAPSLGKNINEEIASNVKVASNFSTNGYVMEIAIPWAQIGITPEKGTKMGFDIMAFDGNDDGSILVWCGDQNNWQSTENYGILTLTEATQTDTGNGGTSGGSDVTTPAATDDTSVNGAVITVQPTVKDGVASAEVPKDAIDKALSAASTAKIVVPAVEGSKEYVQTLPVSSLQSADGSKKIQIETPIGTVTLPSNALKETKLEQTGVQVSIAKADKTKLSEELQNKIGDRPIVELSFKVDGKAIAWSNADAPAKVTVNYTATAEELKDPEHIVVWYIDNTGTAIPVPNGKYDAATGTITFTTTHFSKYAITFVNKTFSDTGKFGWAEKSIEVLASKGIIDGTSETTFSPADSITRADFVTLLMKTLGLTQKADFCFDDVKPGDYYYDAVATAKKLGITNGTGDNKFSPKENISREDMIVLTEKALKIVKGLAMNGSSKDLDKFADKSRIASYAQDSIANFVNAGLITGSNGNINPKQSTTRAEAAVLLYKIYNKD